MEESSPLSVTTVSKFRRRHQRRHLNVITTLKCICTKRVPQCSLRSQEHVLLWSFLEVGRGPAVFITQGLTVRVSSNEEATTQVQQKNFDAKTKSEKTEKCNTESRMFPLSCFAFYNIVTFFLAVCKVFFPVFPPVSS